MAVCSFGRSVRWGGLLLNGDYQYWRHVLDGPWAETGEGVVRKPKPKGLISDYG
jgi:hypothetical protein